jgi:hypothetical protein
MMLDESTKDERPMFPMPTSDRRRDTGVNGGEAAVNIR